MRQAKTDLRPYHWHCNNTQISTWFERDRAMVRLLDNRDNETIILEKNATAKIYFDYDADTSWMSPEELRQVENGSLGCYCVVVSTFDKTGEVQGSDVLGGIWATSQDYILETIKEHDMLKTAKKDLKLKITNILKAYKG